MPIYGHKHSHHTSNDYSPTLDNAPRVPKNITHSRINNFLATGGQFHGMGIHRGLWKNRYSGSPHVELQVYSVPELKRIPFDEAIKQKFEDFKLGQRQFGPSWSTHWFYVTITIPKELSKQEVVLQWDMDCEGMVWTTDGIPLQGLTGGSDQSRHEFILTKHAKGGEKLNYYIETACNGMFGVGANDAMVADPNRYFSLKIADLVVPNRPLQTLFHDLEVIRGIAYDTDETSSRARQALSVCNRVINQFIGDDPDAIQSCLDLTQNFLKEKNGSGQHQVTAVGNCHIDTAWLWPYDETKRKIARSWSTQLDLISRYPDYVFTGSQVQQYEWLQELYPPLFEKIKQVEKTGQWEIIGGSWVEHDTNMPSGESLCRQMLLGQRFYQTHFGKRTKVFWLPDSFGYSGQLPQILRLSGCDYFFTQKLSWNNINKFPLTTFWWTGIDDSRVLAHLTPAETYTAAATTSDVYRCAKNHHDIESSNESLLVYGHGDGGGGPTPAMLERISRMKNLDGLPSVKFGSATGFFEGLKSSSERLQAYKGELYLEFHRGTYTTQALVKRGNRKGEVILRDVEFLATAAKIYSNYIDTDYSYPTDEINRLWKLLCLNQFHDCLPGSAINLAYVDVHKFHREVISKSSILRHKSQSFLISETAKLTSGLQPADEKRKGVIVFNTLPWVRSDVISVPRASSMFTGQQYLDGHECVLIEGVPGLGAAGYVEGAQTPITDERAAKAYRVHEKIVLENPNLKAVFNLEGQLLELVDKKSDRGNLVRGKANVLQLYEDVPTYWDAWDVEIYHLQKYVELEGQSSLKIVSNGPLLSALEFEHKISDVSHLKQTITLSCIGDRLEFETVVDWHESHQFLKVEFNWDIVTDYATYDIQYGVIKRPNHYNTSHDLAKFEVCGHKFADLSDSNYGIAILNDCKYGYATHGSTQRLSLLRSPKGPDEHADMGQHTFKYAIYPHQGNYINSRVMQTALEFNVPLSIRYAKGNELQDGEIMPSLFKIESSDQIIIDTVKLAEDDGGKGKQVVLRLYEAYGGRSTGILVSELDIKRIQVTNILEDDSDVQLEKKKKGYSITLKPFQILTLKIDLK